MNPVFDEAQVSAWISNLYGEAEGYINIVSTDNWAGRCFQDVDQAVSYVKYLDSQRAKGIYARATTLRQAPENGQRGGVNHTSEFVGFWADLDITGPGHKFHVCDGTPCTEDQKPGHRTNLQTLPPSIEECMAIIEVSGLPAPTEWVHSGGGMYPWWLLPGPRQYTNALDVLTETSANWQRVIELASNKLGYHYGAGVGDLSRVLRIPGTINRKVADQPVACEWRMDLSTSRPYEYAELTTALNKSLAALDKPKPVTAPGFTPPAASTPGTRPGDAFNAATTWPQLLEADGAQIFRDRGIGYIEWTRPGKDRRDGMSATTGYKGSDVLKVFTDSWLPLCQDETYDRFGYYAATQHNGNIREATKALAALGYGEKRAWRPGIDGWAVPAERELTLDDGPWRPPVPAEYETVADLNHWSNWTSSPGTGNYEATAEQAEEAFKDVPKPPKRHRYDISEVGMADRLFDSYSGHMRYVVGRKQWLHHRDGVWSPNENISVFNVASQLTTDLLFDADQLEETEREKIAKALKPLRTAAKLRGIEYAFSQRSGILTSVDDLDTHKHMITVGNGVLNINTMAFGPHDHNLLATKKLDATYDPEATAPGWQKFLEDVLPDPEVRNYVQRAMGYTLTGEADQRAIFLLHGPSGTGKTQFLNAIGKIFGTFGKSADPGIFTMAYAEAKSAATPGLHKLRGARLVTSTELPENMKIDEALVKRLTGMDVVNSRDLYQSEESWTPDFAIWMATNYLPQLSSDDDAIWRRMKPIRFDQKFGTSSGKPEIYGIGEKLATTEAAGILNWLLEGLNLYRQHGLGDIQAVTDGVADYQAETDPVLRFLASAITDEAVIAEEDAKVSATLLYSWFTAWCAEEGIRYPISQTRFGRRLRRAGYEWGRDSTGRRTWVGLRAGRDTWIVSGQRWRE